MKAGTIVFACAALFGAAVCMPACGGSDSSGGFGGSGGGAQAGAGGGAGSGAKGGAGGAQNDAGGSGGQAGAGGSAGAGGGGGVSGAGGAGGGSGQGGTGGGGAGGGSGGGGGGGGGAGGAGGGQGGAGGGSGVGGAAGAGGGSGQGGTGGVVDGGGDAGPSVDQACADWAKGYCDKIGACAAWLITASYGDAAACVARLKIGCAPAMGAPGTLTKPNELSACAAALAPASCADLFSNLGPQPCNLPPGTVANALGCGTGLQCKSTYCVVPSGQLCGKCATLAPSGGACPNGSDDCDYGLLCTKNKTCAAPAKLNETCGDAKRCMAGLSCMGTAPNKKCVVEAGLGQTCDDTGTTAPDCDIFQGLFCHPTTKKCAQIQFTGPGGTCGWVGQGYTDCQAGGTCKGSGQTGTCVAPALDGSTCDPSASIDCLAPAVCLGGSCKLPNPAACP